MTQVQPVSNSNCRITGTSCLLNHRCSFQISRAYYHFTCQSFDLSVPDEEYSRHASWTLNYISTFLFPRRRISNPQDQSYSLSALADTLVTEWSENPKVLFQLLRSFQNRCRIVIRPRDGHTRY